MNDREATHGKGSGNFSIKPAYRLIAGHTKSCLTPFIETAAEVLPTLMQELSGG